MQDHLKERLTGAAILVAVVVLLVPELFHGRPPVDTGAAASAAGPPVRSVTIDLGDAAATRPLTENAPAAPPTVAPAAAPVTAKEGAPTTAPENATTTAPESTAPPPAKPAVASPKPATPAPPMNTTAIAAAPAAAKVPPTAHGSAVKSGWTVQVGSFARREFADRMVKDAAAKGFTVEVAGPDDRGLYRVRSPPRADRGSAMALKQKMQASGFKPIVNKTP